MEFLFENLLTAWRFIEKGGVITYPLVAFSFVAAAVIIERWITYNRAERGRGGWMVELLDRVEKTDFDGAAGVTERSAHPSARVVRILLDKLMAHGRPSRSNLEKLAGHYGHQEVRELERYLPTLSTIGNVAPLLGLMGTVLGMVKAFMRIEDLEGKVNAAVLAGGIWEALLTTLFGLAVAIPAVIAHNYLSARVRRMAGDIQDNLVSFVDAAYEAIDKPECDDKDGGGDSK